MRLLSQINRSMKKVQDMDHNTNQYGPAYPHTEYLDDYWLEILSILTQVIGFPP
jgi:hypothetical protein